MRTSKEQRAHGRGVVFAMRLAFTVGVTALLGSCAASEAPKHRPLPELARLADENADPRVLEVSLEARLGEVEYLPGKPTVVWTYGGTVPGPLLEARVGDELVVHFRNSLPEATTLHWHGLRLPAEMDGTQAMQAPVPPGGTFLYRFRLLDAGLFWFHPHVRADVQVEKGLYGVVLVRAEDEPSLGRERVLVLDDVLLNANGSLVPHEQLDASMLMTGLQGNVWLANGVPAAELQVAPGERLRLRVLNAANARYFRLALPGRRMLLVGVDGGLLEAPRELEEVLLAPGERVDLVLQVDGAAGETWELLNLPYERGHMTGGDSPAPVLRLRLVGPRLGELAPLPAALREIAPLPEPIRARRLVLTEEMEGASGGHGGHGSGSGPRFFINGEAHPHITPLEARLGEVESWEVVNETEMDHPFHLHGFFFQVVERAGLPEGTRAWKDTVNVPAESSLKFRVRFDDFPGRWMYHCHILEHGERGMMGELLIRE